MILGLVGDFCFWGGGHRNMRFFHESLQTTMFAVFS